MSEDESEGCTVNADSSNIEVLRILSSEDEASSKFPQRKEHRLGRSSTIQCCTPGLKLSRRKHVPAKRVCDEEKVEGLKRTLDDFQSACLTRVRLLEPRERVGRGERSGAKQIKRKRDRRKDRHNWSPTPLDSSLRTDHVSKSLLDGSISSQFTKRALQEIERTFGECRFLSALGAKGNSFGGKSSWESARRGVVVKAEQRELNEYISPHARALRSNTHNGNSSVNRSSRRSMSSQEALRSEIHELLHNSDVDANGDKGSWNSIVHELTLLFSKMNLDENNNKKNDAGPVEKKAVKRDVSSHNEYEFKAVVEKPAREHNRDSGHTEGRWYGKEEKVGCDREGDYYKLEDEAQPRRDVDLRKMTSGEQFKPIAYTEESHKQKNARFYEALFGDPRTRKYRQATSKYDRYAIYRGDVSDCRYESNYHTPYKKTHAIKRDGPFSGGKDDASDFESYSRLEGRTSHATDQRANLQKSSRRMRSERHGYGYSGFMNEQFNRAADLQHSGRCVHGGYCALCNQITADTHGKRGDAVGQRYDEGMNQPREEHADSMTVTRKAREVFSEREPYAHNQWQKHHRYSRDADSERWQSHGDKYVSEEQFGGELARGCGDCDRRTTTVESRRDADVTIGMRREEWAVQEQCVYDDCYASRAEEVRQMSRTDFDERSMGTQLMSMVRSMRARDRDEIGWGQDGRGPRLVAGASTSDETDSYLVRKKRGGRKQKIREETTTGRIQADSSRYRSVHVAGSQRQA